MRPGPRARHRGAAWLDAPGRRSPGCRGRPRPVVCACRCAGDPPRCCAARRIRSNPAPRPRLPRRSRPARDATAHVRHCAAARRRRPATSPATPPASGGRLRRVAAKARRLPCRHRPGRPAAASQPRPAGHQRTLATHAAIAPDRSRPPTRDPARRAGHAPQPRHPGRPAPWVPPPPVPPRPVEDRARAARSRCPARCRQHPEWLRCAHPAWPAQSHPRPGHRCAARHDGGPAIQKGGRCGVPVHAGEAALRAASVASEFS